MTAAADAATDAATEVVQKAAAPLAFIAVVIAGALAVGALVRRFGQSLPLPAYVADFVMPDDADDEDQGDTADENEYPQDSQW